MSSDYDIVPGESSRIRRYGQKYYLFVSEKDIMFSAPNEADIKYSDTYSLIHALCRVISKGMEEQLTWEIVVDQLDKASLGRPRTWAADIAQKIRDSRLKDDRNC